MTELVFILDRSGSMAGLEADTISGFNSMIAKQKKESGEAFVSTVLFDNESTVTHDRLPLSEVPPMTEKEYFTRGCTALLDVVDGAIHHIGNIHKYARPEDVPEKTLFVITTDGYENSSRRYDYEAVRRMIDHEKEKYGWEFLFLGANINAADDAEHTRCTPHCRISCDKSVSVSIIKRAAMCLRHARFLFFRFFPSALADYIARAVLGLHVYLPDILAYDAEAYKLHAADKADNAGHARPACDGLAAQRRDERPEAADKAYQRDDDAEACDELERLY